LETFKVHIEKMAFGGDGIARLTELGGLVLFVALAAPGDELLVKIIEKKKNFARAEIIEIISPGPARAKPPCPYFGPCGGCNFQQLSYEEQLRQKENIVREQLKNHLGDAQWEPIEPSPRPLRYRNRIQLKYDRPRLGFYARGSHDIVDIEDCLITEDSLAQKIPALKKDLAAGKKTAIAKIELLLKSADLSSGKAGDDTEIVFEDSPFEGVGFSQVNRFQNEHLIATVLEWAAASSFSTVYDFYAGAGNFTFPLLQRFPQAKTVGVELNPKTVALAQKKISDLALSPKRIEFFLGDVELFLKRTILAENALVLLDPPRAGCSENTLRYLGDQSLTRLLYVSCDPSSLARDLSRLRAQTKPWKVARVKPFDMFPQTDHVETLVELVR
jgi:23S rRNA (uracil1939-C5)-methyltransferase